MRVEYIVGGIAEHAFGADIEDLDHALFIGGNAGEVGAVEDCVLQGPGFQQGFLAFEFDDFFSP
jgi:hypothetical protein